MISGQDASTAVCVDALADCGRYVCGLECSVNQLTGKLKLWHWTWGLEWREYYRVVGWSLRSINFIPMIFPTHSKDRFSSAAAKATTSVLSLMTWKFVPGRMTSQIACQRWFGWSCHEDAKSVAELGVGGKFDNISWVWLGKSTRKAFQHSLLTLKTWFLVLVSWWMGTCNLQSSVLFHLLFTQLSLDGSVEKVKEVAFCFMSKVVHHPPSNWWKIEEGLSSICGVGSGIFAETLM